MNPTINRRSARFLLTLLAAGFSGSACGRGLFGISSADHQDAGGVRDLAPDSHHLPAGLSVCFPDHPASCDETCRQATRVLWDNCASCHGDPNAPIGLPPWNFVMDPHRLTTESWYRQGQPPTRFVLPGDPGHSAVYLRAVIAKDMPPLQIGVSQPYYPRVSQADGQILNDWISGCLGVAGPASPADGAADGSLIASGPVVCPTDPPTGTCPAEHQYCLYPTKTCLCSGATWQCLDCPGQQPSIGASCAPAPGRDGLLTFRCGYGSVSCSCDRRAGVVLPAWGCGVCPASRPGDGTACGNSSFSCDYDNDICMCVDNNWSCVGDRGCPDPVDVNQSGDSLWLFCQGTNACSYPSLGQSCACSPGGRWDCSCPAARPREASACAPVLVSPACTYGDQSCSCVGSGGWHCVAACPVAPPVAGDACNSALSCSYDGGLCYCDGSHWQCS